VSTARLADLLLVEPHDGGAELTRRLLERAGWRHVVVTARGEEALELLQGGPDRRLAAMPRLVLMDPALPGLDGFAVLERIREHPASRLVPVLLFAGALDAGEVVRGYRLGANGVIPKPADYDRYADLVRRLSGYWLGVNAPPP
jgi:CheY-like chemotaxis protein